MPGSVVVVDPQLLVDDVPLPDVDDVTVHPCPVCAVLVGGAVVVDVEPGGSAVVKGSCAVVVLADGSTVVDGPAGAPASEVDGRKIVGGVGPGPVLGGVDDDSSGVVFGTFVVAGAVVAVGAGCVVEVVGIAVASAGAATVVGAVVARGVVGRGVVGRGAVDARVVGVELVTVGPAGGADAALVGGGATVVVGSASEAVSTLLSSGAASAIDRDGIESSSATCSLRAFTAWYAMGPATTSAVSVDSAKARPRREVRSSDAIWFMSLRVRWRSAPVV